VDTSSQPSDIELLSNTFSGWAFGAVWTTAANGPDHRRLVAIRGGIILSAWDADSLATQVTAEQIAEALRDDDGD
jgi:hypothetical protein